MTITPPNDPLDPLARPDKPGPNAPKDTSVQVRTAGGVLLVGVPIRRDVVLVRAGGLAAPVTITIDGREVAAVATHEITRGRGSWHPLTALELPEGTLPMVGERVPADLADLVPDHPGRHGARTPFWCLVFPRMRGC